MIIGQISAITYNDGHVSLSPLRIAKIIEIYNKPSIQRYFNTFHEISESDVLKYGRIQSHIYANLTEKQISDICNNSISSILLQKLGKKNFKEINLTQEEMIMFFGLLYIYKNNPDFLHLILNLKSQTREYIEGIKVKNMNLKSITYNQFQDGKTIYIPNYHYDLDCKYRTAWHYDVYIINVKNIATSQLKRFISSRCKNTSIQIIESLRSHYESNIVNISAQSISSQDTNLRNKTLLSYVTACKDKYGVFNSENNENMIILIENKFLLKSSNENMQGISYKKLYDLL